MRPLLIGLLIAAGCGGGDEPTTPEEQAETTIFIALQRDFQAFPSWEHYHLDGDGSGTPHTGFNRDVYINKRPSKGATQFPVGTIIVKRTDGAGDIDGPRTFAMVKRGGDYNKAGALNWEWFELLQSNPDDAASPWQISWRGLGPPVGGSSYGAGGESECSSCHAQAQPNDYVQTQVLQLSTLAR